MKIVIYLDDHDKDVIKQSAVDLIYDITGQELSESQLRDKCHEYIIKLMEGINLQEKTTELVDKMMFEVHNEFFKCYNNTVTSLNKSIYDISGLLNKGGMDSKSK